MDWGSFTIDGSSVAIFFKVVNASGKCDFLIGSLSGFCSDIIDKIVKLIICFADNDLESCI